MSGLFNENCVCALKIIEVTDSHTDLIMTDDIPLVLQNTESKLQIIDSSVLWVIILSVLFHVCYFFEGCVLKLVQASGSCEITDDNEEVQHLCECLERVFQKGLLRNNTLGFPKVSESWYWLEQLTSQHNG